jgi:hypothetical protein
VSLPVRRVLYIDHPTPDFLAAVLHKGLCEEIGHESVIDFPWKALYHGYGYEGEGAVHVPFAWSTIYPDFGLWSEEDVVRAVGTFDVVILASPRSRNTLALERLIYRVGRGALRKLVIVDGEDYTTVRWDLVERLQPDVYFKLSMVPEPFEVYPALKARLAASTKVVPFALACPTSPLAAATKDIDVSFVGGNYWRPAALRREGVPWAGRPEAEYKK